jgi:hypothetical protein
MPQRLQFPRRGRPTLSTQLRAAGARLRLGLLILIALCLLLILRCLDLIGPPPRVRVNILWVNQHIGLVRVILSSLAVAAIATSLLILSGRGRIIAIALWVAAITAAIWLYDDRLWIILRVVLRFSV